LDFQLNHPGSYITSKTCAQDAGGRLLEELDLAEGLVRTAIIRQTEIRMVEEIEELETDPEHAVLLAGELRILHDAEVSIEVAWPTKAVPSLGKSDSSAAARA
jgi:hypothetical protein